MKAVLADALVWDLPRSRLASRNRSHLRRFRDIGVDVVTLNVGFDAVPSGAG
ncbi:MAG: hypothetical protein U1F35_15995 [Steroidobacteraceae bacterium]